MEKGMILLVTIVAAIILAAPFLSKWYLKRATARLKLADRVWGKLEQHAHALLEDRTLDPYVGDLVEGIVGRAGDGVLTRTFLFSLIFRGKVKGNKVADALNALNTGQTKQFTRFAVTAVLYDSLRTSLSGAILRRVVLYWLEATAKDEKAVVNQSQVAPIAAAAGRAYHLA